MKVINVELHGIDGTLYRYDSFSDGPLNEWLLATVPRLGKGFNGILRNSTIRVFERSQ